MSDGKRAENLFDDPNHWLNRAKELRAIAEQIRDPDAKLIMLNIADGYLRLADRAAERIASRPAASQ